MTTHTTGEHDDRSNWLEANKLAIYKSSREAELGTPKNKSSKQVIQGRGLNSVSPDCKPSTLTAPSRCVLC